MDLIEEAARPRAINVGVSGLVFGDWRASARTVLQLTANPEYFR